MRARAVAFKDDTTVLEASREQLRIEFNKNRAVTDQSKIGQSSHVSHTGHRVLYTTYFISIELREMACCVLQSEERGGPFR